VSVWDTYQARLNVRGGDRRNVVLQREKRYLNAKLPASLSYHHAVVNGELRDLAIGGPVAVHDGCFLRVEAAEGQPFGA